MGRMSVEGERNVRLALELGDTLAHGIRTLFQWNEEYSWPEGDLQREIFRALDWHDRARATWIEALDE